MVDWSATGEMLTGLGTIAGAISILAAALIGRNAAKNFRSQKQIEKEIEHAEKALTVAYQLQSAISSIRNPMSTTSELASSRKELERFKDSEEFINASDADKKRMIQANVFYQRIRHWSDVHDRALAVVPFVKAYFGVEIENALRILINARNKVAANANAYARDQGRDTQRTEKIESYIWEGGLGPSGQDPIADEVNSSIETLEKHFLPIINRNSCG